mmetsp:Transcript_2415/g.5393  ORF Transcript_2415/g.5393 Transcript_2415/m.5393 type:complete len:227 (+) Transcript_2415:135-815(+)
MALPSPGVRESSNARGLRGGVPAWRVLLLRLAAQHTEGTRHGRVQTLCTSHATPMAPHMTTNAARVRPAASSIAEPGCRGASCPALKFKLRIAPSLVVMIKRSLAPKAALPAAANEPASIDPNLQAQATNPSAFSDLATIELPSVTTENTLPSLAAGAPLLEDPLLKCCTELPCTTSIPRSSLPTAKITPFSSTTSGKSRLALTSMLVIRDPAVEIPWTRPSLVGR